MRLVFIMLSLCLLFNSLSTSKTEIPLEILQELTKDLEYVAAPKTLIGGDPNLYIVKKKGESKESLLYAFAKEEKNLSPLKGLENLKADPSVMKTIDKWENEKIEAVQFELPQLGSIYGNILYKGPNNLKSKVLHIAYNIAQFALKHAKYLRFNDLNPKYIFLDSKMDPSFFLATNNGEKPIEERQLVFAIASVIYLIYEDHEVQHNMKNFDDIQFEEPIAFPEGTNQDISELIRVGLDQSKFISIAEYQALIESKIKSPSLEVLETEMYFVPASNLFVGDKDLTEPLKWTILFVYMALFLLGTCCFCMAKKPLQEQQARNAAMMRNRMQNQQQMQQQQNQFRV